MTSIEHGNNPGPAGFTAERGRSITGERITAGLAVIGLTNLAGGLRLPCREDRARRAGDA